MKKYLNFGSIEVVAKGINWVYIPVLAIFLDANLFGSIVFFHAFVAVCAGGLYIGQNRVILMLYNKARISPLLPSALVVGIAGMVLCVLMYATMQIEYMFAAIAALSLVLHTLLCLFIRASKDIAGFAALRLTYVILRLVFGTILIVNTQDITTFFVVEVVTVFASLLIYIVIRDRKTVLIQYSKFSMRDIGRECVSNLNIGLPIFIQSLLFILAQNADRLLMEKFGLTAFLPKYGLIVAIASSVTFVMAYLSIKYEFEIYNAGSKRESKLISAQFFHESIKYSLILLPILLGVFYVFSVYKEYHFEQFDIFVILSVYAASVVMAKFHSFSYYASSQGNNRIVATCALTVATLSIALIASLMGWLGYLGLVIAKFMIVLVIYYGSLISTRIIDNG